MNGPTAVPPRVRWRTVGIVALLVLAGVAAAIIIGTRQPPPPALPGAAGNGLIAYSYAGEIFVGDPVTGTTKAIVSGPESHVNAIFSPDGRLIAFVRGDPYFDASLVVVRADGSDERVVSKRGVTSAWTPDSTSLVVNHGHGQLSLFDASGVAEPWLLTPPLPAMIGAMYFNPSAQVAPMFQPPDGELILSSDWDVIEVWDGDLENATQLARQSLEVYEHYFVRWPTWSPDGAMIAFGLDLYDPSNRQYIGGHSPDLFVMNAYGGDLRPLGEGWNPLWSPDSSSIAFERWSPGPDRSMPRLACFLAGSMCTAVIVVIDLGSGTERILEATSAEQKVGSDFHTITFNTDHTWYYEGWSWAPDGRSLLVLENNRTRPLVVDVETGQATELPWEADSAPTWQRVATD